MTTTLDRPDLAGLTARQLAEALAAEPYDADVLTEVRRRDALQHQRRVTARRESQAPWYDAAYQQYLTAERELSGVLLSHRGVAKGRDPWPWLWTGPLHMVQPYMSWELAEWWESHPRVTVTEHQRQERRATEVHDDEHDAGGHDAAVRLLRGAGALDGGGRPEGSGDRSGAGLVGGHDAGGIRDDGRRPAADPVPRSGPVRDTGHVRYGRRAVSPAVARVAAMAQAIRAGVPYDPQDHAEPVPVLSPAPEAGHAAVAVREPGTVVAGRRLDINGAETLNFARMVLARFALWPSEAALDAVTLWDMHTHARDPEGVLVTQTSPRLLFQSAEPGSGKTQAMTLAARLCPKPHILIEPSEAAVAHLIGKEHGTLFFDESDVFFGRGNRKAAVRALFNSGYTRDGTWARVRNGSVESIGTFGGLAMAGLEKMETGTYGSLKALFSRVIKILMRRAPEGYRPPRWDSEAAYAAAKIAERMSAWASQNLSQIASYVPEVPEGIGNRAAQLWEPLLVVADLAGGRWPEAARLACEELTLTGDMAPEDDQDAAELDRILAGWGGDL